MTVAARYTLEEMPRQVDALADDLRALVTPTAERARQTLSTASWENITRVVLTGNGDSYHAALATEMAFASLAGVACEPRSTLRLLEYGIPDKRDIESARSTLTVAISASGGNARAVQTLTRASRSGARTLAITCSPGSLLAQAADHALIVPLPPVQPCPGIRTYQASLLGLFLVAIELGQARTHHLPVQPEKLLAELTAAGDAIEATSSIIGSACAQLGRRVAGEPVMMMLGSGPSYGSALFAAAKMVEAAGVFAAGQDLEEWEHVESLALPRNMPTFILGVPGRSRERAVAVARRARDIGRTVIAVADATDTELATVADTVLPLCGTVREEFSPLLTHIFAGYLTCEVARQLNRVPFSTKH